jgi:hypothetical protein
MFRGDRRRARCGAGERRGEALSRNGHRWWSINFDVRFKHRKPKSATNFFFNVHVHCSDGASGGRSFSYTGVRPVIHRKFSYTFKSFRASFHGTIKRSGHKAFGTVRYGPNYLTGHPGCTTGGPKSWTAST